MCQTNTVNIESHVLRKYLVLQKIGSGAYGHVWKVQNRKTKQIYALKKIFDAFKNTTDAQRTYREATILSQLTHPNIIKLYETISSENKLDLYIVMMYMETDLHQVIFQNILKDIHIKYITYQIAKALKYLHSGYLIHRDLKPSNILINGNCQIKLCDFGLVRSIAQIQDSILTEGVVTRCYRPPQILLEYQSYSTPADVWSFGCIIYQMIARKPLFFAKSTINHLQKILQFTGFPLQQDIQGCASKKFRFYMSNLIKPVENKVSQILRNFNSQFSTLIQKMLKFNPLQRITINQILNLKMFQPFRNTEDQIMCPSPIKTIINDNHKQSVQRYRDSIYSARKTSLHRTNKTLQSQKISLQKYRQSKLQDKGFIIKYIKQIDVSQRKIMAQSTEGSEEQLQKNNNFHYTSYVAQDKFSRIVKKKISKKFTSKQI